MFKFKKQVNILGTKYRIEIHKMSKDKYMKDKGFAGYCSEERKLIVIADMSEKEYFGGLDEIEKEIYARSCLRHEIVHAFLNESGLSDNANQINCAWAKNEEMVDWIALQGAKIYRAWQEAGAIQ